MDQQIFEGNVRQIILELRDLTQEYDQVEHESDVAQFAKQDPLKNLISALAAKLRSEQHLSRDESLKKADEILSIAELQVNKPTAKQRICAAVKELPGDSLSLLPILIDLMKSGGVAIPFDPTGVFLAGTACLVVVRIGIASYCTE